MLFTYTATDLNSLPLSASKRMLHFFLLFSTIRQRVCQAPLPTSSSPLPSRLCDLDSIHRARRGSRLIVEQGPLIYFQPDRRHTGYAVPCPPYRPWHTYLCFRAAMWASAPPATQLEITPPLPRPPIPPQPTPKIDHSR